MTTTVDELQSPEPRPPSPVPLTGNAPTPRGKPLGQQLAEAGLLEESDLARALTEQSGRRLGEVLLEMGLVSEEDLLPFMEERLSVPAARLREGLVDPAVVKRIPREVAEERRVLALFEVRGTLHVAMAEPQDLSVIDDLERITGLRVEPAFAFESSVERLLPRAYEEDFTVDAVTADVDGDAVRVDEDAVHIDLHQATTLAGESPVISLVNYVLVHAVRQGASDVHIEPGHGSSVVRVRVDGQLREILRPRPEHHAAIVSRIKVLAKMDIAEHRLPQDGRVHVVVDGRKIDLRVSTLPTVLGEKVVLRVLDRANVTFDLGRLGIPDHQYQTLSRILKKPFGLALVTGPTGSGKTTTLYSALELVKSVHTNIVTVEDPVEYQLEMVNQVQASAASKLTFAGALRSILRQDPDVIMIGEIRDRETAEVAVQASLTGHLVLSTLHTNDSAGAITRLVDMGIVPFKIAASLAGVVAQRLVRTNCPHCSTQYFPPDEQLDLVGFRGDRRRQFVRGEGCRNCYDTGFEGRVGIYEILFVDGQLRELIGRNPDLEELRRFHREQGGTTLLNEGVRLAQEGRTSLDEVIRAAHFD